ncbi:hypothetical protein DPEC_G00298380 [Dallia pectoralis]|uniref:Uncharacterized protein n=1 Tax=Dallia pectoralis TaxID=75939 RepID=A0ACC2FFU9_DALPE|nr:hypothetical protein DPEC_G00298380 [Dallia pectoralis]
MCTSQSANSYSCKVQDSIVTLEQVTFCSVLDDLAIKTGMVGRNEVVEWYLNAGQESQSEASDVSQCKSRLSDVATRPQ